MQKKFITNLSILLFLNLLIKPFWILGIDRAVQNTIGAEDYGTYFALFNFSLILNILLDLGITNFNNRNISQNHHLLEKHLSGIVMLKFILAVFYLVIVLIAGWAIGYDLHHMGILLVLSFNQFLLSFILYLRSNIAGLQMFKTDSCFSVLDRVLMIGICGFLLLNKTTKAQFKLEWFIYAQTIAYLLTALTIFLIVLYKAKFKRLRWNIPFFRVVLKNSFPYAVLVLLMAFYNRIDTIMIERMLPNGAEQSGIYAQAYRLLDSTNMIAYLFSVLLLPLFSRMLKANESVKQISMLSFKLLITPAIIIAAGSFFYRYDLMKLLYREHIEDSAVVFGILMACFMPICTTYVFGTLLTANGNLKELNMIAALSMVVNVTLNLFLIPHFFAAGSAISSLITQSLNAGLQLFLIKKVFGMKVNFRLIYTLLTFLVGVVAINYISMKLPFQWMLQFLIMGIISVLFAFAIRLISVKGMYRILKYG